MHRLLFRNWILKAPIIELRPTYAEETMRLFFKKTPSELGCLHTTPGFDTPSGFFYEIESCSAPDPPLSDRKTLNTAR